MGDLDELFAEVEVELGGETDVADADPDDTPDVEVDGDDGTIEDDADEPSEEPDGDDESDDEPVEGSEGFDWEAYADQLVPIVVQGETKMVPLGELRSGYMRQDDYTRKTQEVASERDAARWARDVMAALESDPQETILSFARHFGLLDEQAPQPQFDLNEIDEDLRPLVEMNQQLQQKIAELESQVNTSNQSFEMQRQEQLVAEIKSELSTLKSRYGDEFDERSTLEYARDYNLPLEKAHLLRMAERQSQTAQTQQRVSSQVAEHAGKRKSTASERRTAKKRQASGVGTGSYNAADVSVDEFNDIGELFEIVLGES